MALRLHETFHRASASSLIIDLLPAIEASGRTCVEFRLQGGMPAIAGNIFVGPTARPAKITTRHSGSKVVNLLNKPTSKRSIYAGKLREASMKDMKDIMTALLASLFVLISLVSLISADPVPGNTSWVSPNSPASVSELEFRYALRR